MLLLLLLGQLRGTVSNVIFTAHQMFGVRCLSHHSQQQQQHSCQLKSSCPVCMQAKAAHPTIKARHSTACHGIRPPCPSPLSFTHL